MTRDAAGFGPASDAGVSIHTRRSGSTRPRCGITLRVSSPPSFTKRPGLLDKQRSIAGPGFNRWLVPPAALCLHLCIGMAYGFSVFWLPLTRAVGITAPVTCPAEMGFLARLTSTTCDWDKPLLGWIYTLFFVFLGSSPTRSEWGWRWSPVRHGERCGAAACDCHSRRE